MCIEDALRTTLDRLVTLQVFADSLSQTDEIRPQAFSGLADILGDIHSVIRGVKSSMPLDALSVELQSDGDSVSR